MKQLLLLLCSVFAFSVFADAAAEKRLETLMKEQEKTRQLLVDLRSKEIKNDKRLKKIADQILDLNRELAEYLNTKPEIRNANQKLLRLNREIEQKKEKISEKNKK